MTRMLHAAGIEAMGGAGAHIVPIMIGDAGAAVLVGAQLVDARLSRWCACVRRRCRMDRRVFASPSARRTRRFRSADSQRRSPAFCASDRAGVRRRRGRPPTSLASVHAAWRRRRAAPDRARERRISLRRPQAGAIFDAISSWWVTLHGHAQPEIVDAIARASARRSSR